MGGSSLIGKLCSELVEPDDLAIWRYAVVECHIRDSAWPHHIEIFHVLEKIQSAKADGSWDRCVRRFLEKTANGQVPLTAFLSKQGKKWLMDMSGQISD